MYVAPKDYKLDGEFPAPGFVLRMLNPSFDKESGFFYCTVDAYANVTRYKARSPYRPRMYEVRVYADEALVKAQPIDMMGHTKRLAYALPDVMRGWGGEPEADNSNISQADWNLLGNIYAQGYYLLGQLPEFKIFKSDEAKK